MKRPKLLDTFCKAGGAGMGYHKAGFEVVGVDIEPKPNYPFKFIQADAIEYTLKHGHKYDVVHGSPPCQGYSKSTAPQKKLGKVYPDMVSEVREAFLATNRPYIIENVPQAPIRADIVLVGNMFGLNVIRKRHFETNFFILQFHQLRSYGKLVLNYVVFTGNAPRTGHQNTGMEKQRSVKHGLLQWE